jgi:hypothetical protein
MCYKGNISKNKGTKKKSPSTVEAVSESDMSEAEKNPSNPYLHYEPSERTLRTHVAKTKVQGRRGDTVKEQTSAKKMKLYGNFKEETFFMDDIKEETPSVKKKGNEFAQPSSFEVEELSLDSDEEEVQKTCVDSDRKISAKGTSDSSQIFHGSTPHRLMSPMKSSERMYKKELSEAIDQGKQTSTSLDW